MSSDVSATKASKIMYWAGWVIGVLPALMLLNSARFKIFPGPDMEAMLAPMGWPMSVMFGLGIVELVCTILYLIPQTAVLGAILLTGYLGGATATHVRVGDWGHFAFPIAFGVLLWLGLFLRDARIRALVPIRM